MDEVVKTVGGIAWGIGLILLLVAPTLGVAVIIVAILATISSVSRTRRRRHEELLEATRAAGQRSA